MKRATITFCALLTAGYIAGCGTPGSNQSGNGTLGISVSAEGAITLNGKEIELTELSRPLKAAGATPDTRIMVFVPENMPKPTMTAIAGNLASAGFRKVIFIGPRHAGSSTKTHAGTHPRFQ